MTIQTDFNDARSLFLGAQHRTASHFNPSLGRGPQRRASLLRGLKSERSRDRCLRKPKRPSDIGQRAPWYFLVTPKKTILPLRAAGWWVSQSMVLNGWHRGAGSRSPRIPTRRPNEVWASDHTRTTRPKKAR
jgi:hypothetical protein